MAAYLVTLASGNAGTKKADTFIVSANSATDAKAIAKYRYSGVAEEAWDGATVTTLEDVTAGTADALIGYRFGIDVVTPAGAVLETVEYTSVTSKGTIDLVAAELVILLNATASIAGAAYNSGTQVLTVADGGQGGDDLGDHTVNVAIYPPVVNDSGGGQTSRDVNIPGFVASQVHEGASSAVLSVTFAADSYVMPTIYSTTLSR